MKSALNSAVFDQLFHQARTVNAFTEQKLTDEQLHALYYAAKMPPTAFNAQPARFVFITSDATITQGEGFGVVITPADGQKCTRCWHIRTDVGTHADHPELCGRCVTNVDGAGETRQYA